MSRDSFQSHLTTRIHQHSPDEAESGDRKRRRKILSCYDCRRRKLQCDRVMPACGRCTAVGQAASCLYTDEAIETSAQSQETNNEPITESNRAPPAFLRSRSNLHTNGSGHTPDRLEDLVKRVKKLESELLQSNRHATQSPNHQNATSHGSTVQWDDIAASGTPIDRETLLLRGKSFETQFWGISHAGSLVGCIPELGAFTKDTFANFPSLARIQHDLNALEDRTTYADSKQHRFTTDESLKALLPPKHEADELVRLYIDNYDCVYHIIHLPTFQQEYNEIWDNVGAARVHFVALVLLIAATARCLKMVEPWEYVANSSSAREKALGTIRHCENWLQSQSQKRVTVIDFQLRFLILLGKHVNGCKVKRMWTEAGALLKFCMAAGLHRDPDLLRKPTSAMDKELRRRLWSAVTEFELHTAFTRGMLSTSWLPQSDCTPPANIDDSAFDQKSDRLPASKSHHEFTDVSYMTIASKTFMFRQNLNNLLNDIRHDMSFEEAKRCTDKIEEYTHLASHWTGTGARIPQALLCITLLQYLLVLHDRQIRRARSQWEHNFSMMVIIESARKIIDAHKSLVAEDCCALQFLCHDQLRVALSMCQLVSMSNLQANSALNQLLEQNARALVSDVVELALDKVIRVGREQRQLWTALAVNALIKMKRNPENRLIFTQEAVDKISSIHYKIMASQEDVSSVHSARSLNGATDVIHSISTGSSGAAAHEHRESPANNESLLDLDALTAWTFDDWPFEPAYVDHLAEPHEPYLAQ